MKQKNADVDEYIGNRIKELRTRLGITQNELAKRLNITFQQLQKYESGKNRVSASTLLEIACMLNVKYSYFVDGYGNHNVYYDDFYSLNSREIGEITKLYQKIRSSDMRVTILEIIKLLSKYEKTNRFTLD